MKLQLKHLAPYLPYNLRLTKEDWGKIGELVPFVKQDFKGLQIEIDYALSTKAKPILRPLSDLTKEITVNDEDFVPYEHFVFVEAMTANEYLEYLCEARGDLSEDRLLPYSIVKLLFEWHFDVFGLINKGLAIDINDVVLVDA